MTIAPLRTRSYIAGLSRAGVCSRNARRVWRGNSSMKRLATGLFAASALLTSGTAMAQYYPPYGNDLACRQWADAQVAPYRAQAGANAVGSTLLGAGLGAAIGAAAGGGRGAGIGAASGALLGTVGGA